MALTSGRRQILDGASFGTSRVDPLLVSDVVFAHTRRAVEYKCEKKMESAIAQLAKEKTVSYSSHLSDCHNGSRVLVRLINIGFRIGREMKLTFLDLPCSRAGGITGRLQGLPNPQRRSALAIDRGI